jgi:hypothetical protein
VFKADHATMMGTEMDQVETAFAAAVANAYGDAKMLNTAGIVQTASGQVVGALAALWESGRSAGMPGIAIQEIADRHVYWDRDGEPWPRPMGSNVVPLRR